MSTLKVVVRIAAFAGLLLVWGVPAKASGCCAQDCTDAYGTMLGSGVPAGDAAKWYRDCLTACAEHGDPTTCPKSELMAAGDSIDAEACDVAPDALAVATAAECDPIFVPIPSR